MIVVTRFEEYDAGSNVDGLSVIQTDGYDHLVLLPGVHFQKNNPRRVTSTREGEIRKVEYAYQYDTDGKRPLSKTGDLSLTIDGTSAGPHLQLSTVFSYY